MKAYPSYKDSGVPWLGDVPEHWEVIKTKHLFREHVQKGYPNEPLLAATQTKGVVLKSMYENRTVEAQKDLHLLKLVEPGDFVISLRSFQGGIEYAYYRGIISPAYTVMVPNDRILPAYYRHLAKSTKFISLLQTCVTGIREGQNINYEILRKTPLPVPTEDEQQQISRYLDWQTSKINKFIKAKKKLIALLKEQKQNVINEAVTKGINPDVEMKDSGFQLLGEIPTHWQIRKLRHICTFQNGISASGDFFTDGTPFVSYGDVYKNRILPINVTGKAKADINQQKVYSVQKGDIFFTRTSEIIDEIGFTSICLNSIDFAVFSGFLIRARPTKPIIDPKFSVYVFQSTRVRQYFSKEMNLVTRASLGQNLLKNLPVALPPLEEQVEIGTYLKYETGLIDKTITRTEREIELIQEYRTRLVSDVVTGKVDVRSVDIPDFEPVEADLEAQDDEASEDELITEGIEA